MPILHLLAGPNGSGRSTFVTRVLQPVTHLPFVNADVIAAERWPGSELQHAYDASRAAAAERTRRIDVNESFITETVFSHTSKLELVEVARASGYIVHLHVMMLPVDVTVRRVTQRVEFDAGHDVPEQKIRERYARLWDLVAVARGRADRADFYDNSLAERPFRLVAEYQNGLALGVPDWPVWTSPALLS